MKKYKRKNNVKKVLSILLVLSLSINTFSAVVSDNDGSAFITKAEFDSLKNNFQAQLDTYNSQIDYKIDNAIAQYLAGIKTETKKILDNYLEVLYSQNPWAVSFANKETVITGSTNDNFTKGGWWLFWVYGWNVYVSGYNGIINMVNHTRASHNRTLLPSTVVSPKWFVKSYVDSNGNTYYGPYNDKLYNMNQSVYIQKIRSDYKNNTEHSLDNIRYSNQTFDLTALSAPGTILDAGSYNAGWVTIGSISGTNILNYYLYQDNMRRWACMSSAGSCNTSSTYNYCIDYDKQNDLTEERSESSRFLGGSPGAQWQEFKPGPGTAETKAMTTTDGPKFTLKFNTPKVLSLKTSDLCNHVASEFIGKQVPMYAGVPMTSVPKAGKIKFKFFVEDLSISDGSVVTTDTITVAIKSSQFNNESILSEPELLFYDNNIHQGTLYEAEFDINVDKETILYIKADSGNANSFVKVFIDGDIEYTIKQG